jgi:outer membrane protein OmpA-like peptidoglycan-associated protein
MKRSIALLYGALSALLFTASPVSADEQDAKGCKDHPLLTRMPNFYISSCEEKDFDVYAFKDNQGQDVSVEGHKYVLYYEIKDTFTPPSELQIKQNYINAIKAIGGSLLYEEPRGDRRNVYLKVEKHGMVTWIHVFPVSQGAAYTLTLVEQKSMAQDVVADAKTMAAAIGTTGKVAVYGIYFDFNKADVKPESDPTLKEIALLLSQNPTLRLFVVGHTDTVGEFNYNMKLSQARADAVVKVLVSKFGADTNRLKSYGVGPLAPVTSNKTEEGRAKNRRVELVEQ